MKNSQLVAHQAERIKQLEERLRKMQAVIDGTEPRPTADKDEVMADATKEASANTPSVERKGSALLSSPVKVESDSDLHKTLLDWIEKELKITNIEPKSEEHSASLKNLESKLLSEAKILSEGIISSFQACAPRRHFC